MADRQPLAHHEPEPHEGRQLWAGGNYLAGPRRRGTRPGARRMRRLAPEGAYPCAARPFGAADSGDAGIGLSTPGGPRGAAQRDEGYRSDRSPSESLSNPLPADGAIPRQAYCSSSSRDIISRVENTPPHARNGAWYCLRGKGITTTHFRRRNLSQAFELARVSTI